MPSSKTFGSKFKPGLLLRAVHHPDPLTRQQTQRFLDAVTTSFRRNLDKEHGWAAEEHDSPSQRDSRVPSPNSPALVAQKHHCPDSAIRRLPTDHHVASILSNPLFGPAFGPSGPRKRDPMSVFDDAVSKGLMTIRIATGCLNAQHKRMRESRFLSSNQRAIGSETKSGSGVSDRVLQWLKSYGADHPLDLAQHYEFIKAFMPFLVAEGKDHIVWEWIARLMSHTRKDDASFFSARYLLVMLVRSKGFGDACSDGAFESIIHASESYRRDPRHEALLDAAWTNEAFRTAAMSWLKPSPSPSLFETYLALSGFLDPDRTKLPVAHLHLHHPTSPTHDRAVRYFDKARRLEEDGVPDILMRKEALLGVDTVSHLGLVGDVEEAASLMDYIRQRYAAFLDSSRGNMDDFLDDQLEPA